MQPSVQRSPGNLSTALRESRLREVAKEHVDTLATVVAASFNEALCFRPRNFTTSSIYETVAETHVRTEVR